MSCRALRPGDGIARAALADSFSKSTYFLDQAGNVGSRPGDEILIEYGCSSQLDVVRTAGALSNLDETGAAQMIPAFHERNPGTRACSSASLFDSIDFFIGHGHLRSLIGWRGLFRARSIEDDSRPSSLEMPDRSDGKSAR